MPLNRPAFAAKIGDTYPSRDLLPTAAPELVVAENVWHSDGTVTLQFTDGSSDRWPGTEVPTYPRRPDGATYDWRSRYPDAPPLACELRPGDMIPSPEGDTVTTDAMSAHQLVTRVKSFSKLQTPHVQVVCAHPTANVFSYVFWWQEPVTFPRAQGFDRKQPERPEAPGKLEWFGPYRNTRTGATFEFSRHPHGRGRWPHGVDEYNPKLPPRPDGQENEHWRQRFPTPLTVGDDTLAPLAPGLPIIPAPKRKYVRADKLSWS